MVTVQSDNNQRVWVAPRDASGGYTGEARRITTGMFEDRPSWTEDGRIVFYSTSEKANANIWIIGSDGSGAK